MFIYDETAIAFIKKSEQIVHSILKKNGFTVRRSRFLYNNYLYPIQIVVFEDKIRLGFFDSKLFQIGLNRSLIYRAKDSTVKEILTHELAHYLTFIQFGEVQPHGTEFKETCKKLGASEQVMFATADIDNRNDAIQGDLEAERILERIKKLLMLASSDNVHESHLATQKANEILLRHNLDTTAITDGVEDLPLFMKRIFSEPKRSAKMNALYEIMALFLVRPVISHGRGICYLEVTGSRLNVELAEYTAHFLAEEFERLWRNEKHSTGRRGLRAKNSFFKGLGEGFLKKTVESRRSFSVRDAQGLITLEDRLEKSMRKIYRRLSQSHSSARIDADANQAGIMSGQNITIRPGVRGSTIVPKLIRG